VVAIAEIRFGKQRNEPIMKSNEVSTGISMPHVNDVLSGRGGLINKHPGNVQFIEMCVFEIEFIVRCMFCLSRTLLPY
jgi:hypothetical protein